MRANWYWEHWLINKHIRKKYSKSQPKAGKYLLNKKAPQWTPWKRYQNYVLGLEKCSKTKQLQNLPKQTNIKKNLPKNKTNMKKTSTKWMGVSQITTESIAAESSILCANL